MKKTFLTILISALAAGFGSTLVFAAFGTDFSLSPLSATYGTFSSATATSTFSGNVLIGSGQLLPNSPLGIIGSSTNYLQLTVQNTALGNQASSDVVLNNGSSTNTTYFGEFGINGQQFSQATFSGEAAGDTFMLSSDANLDIEAATTTATTSVNILVGGTLSSNIIASFLNGYVGIGSTTPVANLQVTASSTNATTSAEFGKKGQNKGTCLTFFDTAGTPVYGFIAAGATAFTYTATKPIGCQI